MSRIPSHIILMSAMLILAFMAASCDNRNITTFENDGGTYSVYGALSADINPNYVRVKNLSDPFLSESAKALDAEVMFEDLQMGTILQLVDTVINFNGNYVHNFKITQQLQPNRAYKLIVNRSDGIFVESDVTTPAITEANMSIGSITDSTASAKCKEDITFTYRNVKKPENVVMEVGFEYKGDTHWSEIGRVAKPRFIDGRDEMSVRMSPFNLLYEVFPDDHQTAHGLDPRLATPLVLCHQLDTNLVRIRYTHFGPEWDRINPNNGPFDPLDSPDIIGDRGIGFLGAYRKGSLEFFID